MSMTKLELQKQLEITPDDLSKIIEIAGVGDKTVYSQSETDLILEAATRPNAKKSTKSPRARHLQHVDAAPAQGGISLIQEAMASAAQEGEAIARKRVVARFSAMVQEENRLMQQGFQALRSLDDAINAVDIAWDVDADAKEMDDFFDHLFPIAKSAPRMLGN